MTTLLLTLCLISQPSVPVVYISGPQGFTSATVEGDARGPYRHPLGCELKVKWADGKVETLVANQAPYYSVAEWCVSLDGKSVIWTWHGNDARGVARIADIWRMDLATRQKTRLTNASAEWNPPRGTAKWAPHPTPLPAEVTPWRQAGLMHMSRGVWNTSPCELPDGRIIFTSNRDAVRPTKVDWTAMQLYVMDADGKNVEKLGHLNLGGALHPTLLKSGKVAWSSGEMQGLRGGGGNFWGIWEIAPDGGQFAPLVSALGGSGTGEINPFHFQTETSDGSLVVNQYYDTQIYGVLFGIPPFTTSFTGPPTPFGDPDWKKNPGDLLRMKVGTNLVTQNRQFAFQRRGMFHMIPSQTTHDVDPGLIDGKSVGTSSHPAAYPGNGVLFSWRQGNRSGEIGVYLMPDATRTYKPAEFVKIVDEPGVMECFAQALVPYAAIHGVAKPPVFTSPKDDRLLPGEPYGVVGTSSLAWRESKAENQGLSRQGGDNGVATDDIEYIGIVLTKPTEQLTTGLPRLRALSGSPTAYNNSGFSNQFNERVALYNELIPISKWRMPDGSITYGPRAREGAAGDSAGAIVTGPDGQRDTSFAVEVPANQPWTFAYLDADQNILGLAQTWHQLIPGEKYTTCGGCHAHNRPDPFPFEHTFAAKPEYTRLRLTTARPVVEWHQDIKPILQKYGITHTRQSLFDAGIGRDFLSRNSLALMANIAPEMTAEEKRQFSLWIGTGATETGKDAAGNLLTKETGRGAFGDTLPPTLTVLPPPKPTAPVTQIIVGAVDPDSGLDRDSLSVRLSWATERAVDAEMADLGTWIGDRWLLNVLPVSSGEITVSVRDRQVAKDSAGRVISQVGNETRIVRTFTAPAAPPIDREALEREAAEIRARLAELQARLDEILKLLGGQ